MDDQACCHPLLHVQDEFAADLNTKFNTSFSVVPHSAWFRKQFLPGVHMRIWHEGMPRSALEPALDALNAAGPTLAGYFAESHLVCVLQVRLCQLRHVLCRMNVPSGARRADSPCPMSMHTGALFEYSRS